MRSTALDAALAAVDTAFDGCASPRETGCGRCHLPEETAYLRTPHVTVPADVVRMYVYEVSDHFDDHAAAMRRLLPQAARAMADGSLEGVGWGAHGLSRVDWRSWPADQAAAVEAFVHAWWQDVLAMPEPPYPVEAVFETCASIARTVTPFLDAWADGPVADRHLAGCADEWLYHLLSDFSPFDWWYDDSKDAAVVELRTWLTRRAAPRLRAGGQPDLAVRCELLDLPYDERWAHPYWATATAIN